MGLQFEQLERERSWRTATKRTATSLRTATKVLAFEQQLPQYQETARARLLTKALCQELEMLQRQQAKHGKA